MYSDGRNVRVVGHNDHISVAERTPDAAVGYKYKKKVWSRFRLSLRRLW